MGNRKLTPLLQMHCLVLGRTTDKYKNVKNITFLTKSFYKLICKLINLP